MANEVIQSGHAIGRWRQTAKEVKALLRSHNVYGTGTFHIQLCGPKIIVNWWPFSSRKTVFVDFLDDKESNFTTHANTFDDLISIYKETAHANCNQNTTQALR